ncbi:MAG TPA: chromate transporter [Bryobacteraceae bacterium]
MTTEPARATHPLSLLQLVLIHLRVGNLTFGGGDPSLAALHAEIVATKGWISPEEYTIVFALARITPGTNLLAFCAGISWDLLGWVGAMAALLAMTIPASFLIVLLTRSYGAMQSNTIAIAGISGVLAAAVGMMPAAAWQLLSPHLDRRRWLHAILVVGVTLVLSLGFSASPILILGLAALAGFCWRVPE